MTNNKKKLLWFLWNKKTAGISAFMFHCFEHKNKNRINSTFLISLQAEFNVDVVLLHDQGVMFEDINS